jgi:hypothetical protein
MILGTRGACGYKESIGNSGANQSAMAAGENGDTANTM